MPKTPRKVCLVFQRRFTRVAHALALELLKNHGVKEFCGYVYQHTSYDFLKTQRDVPYSGLLLDEDLHERHKSEPLDWNYVNELEKEYGIPNLWPYISIDRIIRYGQGVREYPYDKAPYTHEEMARILQVTARAIIEFLEKEKPDLIYLPAVSALGNMLLYHIGKKKGATVLFGAETRIEGGYALSEDYHAFSFASARFDELARGAHSGRLEEARAYIENFRKKPRTYHYVMESFKESGKRLKAIEWLSPTRVLRLIQFLADRLTRGRGQEYSKQSVGGYIVDALRRKARSLRGFDDLYESYDRSEPFVYFPLHLEPEVALLLLAPRWTDQINLAKQIAESLPFSYKLYVKEHPAMMGYRPRRWYRELKKIPNVKLIHPNHDSLEIVKDAKLVTVITGTAGWEAALLGKPVITFGDVYFNKLPTIKKCEHIEELPSIVRAQLEKISSDDKALEQFVAALLERSEPLHLHELWEKGLAPEEERASFERFATFLMSAFAQAKGV